MADHRTDRLTNRRKKEIASLTQRKFRDERREMLVEGRRSVEAAIDAAAPLREVVVADSVAGAPEVRALTERTTARVYVVTDAELAQLSAVETSQGVLAVVSIDAHVGSELCSESAILALDGVQDPGNAGTLIRTAAWFGVDAVVAGPGTVDLYHPKVVRAAMGALWDVKLSRLDDLAALIEECRRGGLVVYGADLEGTPVGDWVPAAHSLLILGSESHGISPDVAALLDERVLVPGRSSRRGTESLNVAVAAGILMYAWMG